MPSPTFSAIGAKAGINNTSSVSRPTVTAGDLMLMFVVVDYANATFTPPSGWTLGDAYDNNGAFNSEARWYWKIAGSSEAASYSVTISGNPGGNNTGGAVIAAWSGAHQTTPINAYAQTQSGTGATTIPCPSVTTTVADTTLVCFYGDRGDFSSTTYTPPSGMTERFDDRFGSPGGEPGSIADKAVAAIGATGTQNATSSASRQYFAFSIAIAPSAGGGTTTGTISWTEANDTVSASGSVSGSTTTGTIAWTEANDTVSAAGTVTSTNPTITITGIKNNTGTVRASETFTAYVHHNTTGALVVKLDSQTTDSNGTLVLTDAALSAATSYRVDLKDSDGNYGVGVRVSS
jgi:hypothetical protein